MLGRHLLDRQRRSGPPPGIGSKEAGAPFPPPANIPQCFASPQSRLLSPPESENELMERNTLSVVHRPIAVNIDPTGKGFIRPDPRFRSLPCAASLGRHLSRCPVRVHGPGI